MQRTRAENSGRRHALITAAAGDRARHALVAIVTSCVVLSVAGCTATAPAPTPTPTPTNEVSRSTAVAARLQEAVYARLPGGARTAPALTWQDPDPESTGDAVDDDGKTLLLAAACEGTGTLTITVTREPDRVLACSRTSSVGPIDLTPVGDPPGAIEFDVRVTSGAPQYFAKMVAVPAKTSSDRG